MSNDFVTDKHDSALPEDVARPLSVEENNVLVFAILASIQATLIFTIVMIGVPLPAIGAEFQLVQAELVLVSAAYGLPFSGLLLFGGRLTDRYSGRKMFTLGMLIFGLASLSGMFASSYWLLVAIRFLQGIGAALTAPALMALLRQLYREVGQFNHAMATWGGVSVLGGAVGFLSSGIVTTWLSWRWMFIVPVVVSLSGLLLVRRMMKPLPLGDNDSPGLDLSGALLATSGISLFSFGLIMSGEYSWLTAPVYLPVAAGLLLIFTFLLVERHVSSPLLPPGFILNPMRMTGLIGILLAAAGMGLITFLLSLYLQQFRGWSSFATSMAFIPYTVGLLIMNRAARALIMRFGALQITIVGLLLGAVGLLLLAQLNEQTHYVLGLLPGLFILPAGASLTFSGSAVLSTANVPLRDAGLAGGVMNTSMELGPTMGLAALIAVAATQENVVNGYAWAFGAAGGIYLLAAIGALILMKKIN
ncbi:MFS transporter [Serratia sp. DD3]|uniref:MFS transporter n=1 Tax=Serratia sp. DD3 TaxID=1410619 RepID=UPI0003C50A3A|nr:MFS transporter [Serratia sp. DD3]KEY56656.1 putative transport protein HsrA [Serratia sp. DD3]